MPNLAKGMILNGVDQLWVADITFLHLAEQFAFLAVVLDAFRRKVVGWSLDTHLRASLAIEALEMAIADRQPELGSLVHHSDRGVQYACRAYSELLHRHGIQPSMSRVGNPYDNAKAESFMKTLQQEEVQGLAYPGIGGNPVQLLRSAQSMHRSRLVTTGRQHANHLHKPCCANQDIDADHGSS